MALASDTPSATVALPLRPSAPAAKQLPAISYTAHSTLEELPGHAVVRDARTTGNQMEKLFAADPDLPGIILLRGDELIGVISQSHYYKCVSRAFGREIYQGRPVTLMLEELEEPLTLLSSTRIEAAVERCLSRTPSQIYEPFLVYNEARGDYRLCAFQVLLLASSRVAALRNDQMAQILNSVTDGLLVIDRHYRIGNEYSRAAAHLFERTDLERFTLPEVLAPLLDSVVHSQINDYLKVLFNPKMIDRLIKSINPAKQITVNFPLPEPHTKYFTVNFERVRAKTEISQVLVRVEDITQRINLAKELQQQEAATEEKLQLLLQALRVDPTVLREFIQRFQQELVSLEQFMQSGPEVDLQENIHAIFRTTHTLKGEAALLRLAAYERPLHRLEDVLASLRDDPALTTSHLAGLTPARQALLDLDEQMHQALGHLDQLGPAAARNASPVVALLPEAATKPSGPVALVTRLVDDLSRRLNKPALFHTTVRDEELPVPHRSVIQELLLHLARNSMAHGLEVADIRRASGKSALGTLQFAIKAHRDFHELIFQDDGAGLNHDKIIARAAQLGRKLTTTEEIHDAIFLPGFSTADQVDDLAGRGVGLDAIRASVTGAGGSIHVHSEAGSYCAFQILLPKTSALSGRKP